MLRLIYLNQISSIIIDNVSPFFGQSHDAISIELLWFLIKKLNQEIFTDLFWSQLSSRKRVLQISKQVVIWGCYVWADTVDASKLLSRALLIFGESSNLFSKSMKEKILNFLHEVQKMISVISVQVYSKNWISLLKKKTSLSKDKSKFYVQRFSLLKLRDSVQ